MIRGQHKARYQTPSPVADPTPNVTALTITQVPDSALDSDVLHADAAARYCGVSVMAIRRLVAIGVLKREQVVPYAPWEIRRSDLDSPALRSIIERLKRTGRIELEGDGSQTQRDLFTEN